MASVEDAPPEGPIETLKSLVEAHHALSTKGADGDAELATRIVQTLAEVDPWPPLGRAGGQEPWFREWFDKLLQRVFGSKEPMGHWISFRLRDGWLSRVKQGTGAGQRLAKALSELFHPTGRLMSYIASESREATVRRLWRQAIQTQRCERPTLQMQFPFNLLPTDLQKELQVNWRTIMATGGMSGMGHMAQGTRMPQAEGTPAQMALSKVPFWYPLSMEKPFVLGCNGEIRGLLVTPLAFLFLRFHTYLYDQASIFETKAFEWPGPNGMLGYRLQLLQKIKTYTREQYDRCRRFLGLNYIPPISIWRKLGCPELCPHLCALFDMWLSYYIPAPGQPFLRNQMRKQGWGMYSTMHTPVIDTGNFELEKARQEGGELFLRSFLAVVVAGTTTFATNALDQDQGKLSALWNADVPGGNVGKIMHFQISITEGDPTGANALEDVRIRVLMPLQLCFAAVRASHFLLAAEPHGGDTERVRTLARDCFRVVTGHLSLLFRMGSGAMDKITIETEDVPLLDALSVWAALLSPYRLGVACVPFSTGVRAGHRNLVTVAGQADRAPCLTALTDEAATLYSWPQPADITAKTLSTAAQIALTGCRRRRAVFEHLLPRQWAAPGYLSAVEAFMPLLAVRWHGGEDLLTGLATEVGRADESVVAKQCKALRWYYQLSALGKQVREEVGRASLQATATSAAKLLAGGGGLADWELDVMGRLGKHPGMRTRGPKMRWVMDVRRYSWDRVIAVMRWWRRFLTGNAGAVYLPPDSYSLFGSPFWTEPRTEQLKRWVAAEGPCERREVAVECGVEAHVELVKLFVEMTEARNELIEAATVYTLTALHRVVCCLSDPLLSEAALSAHTSSHSGVDTRGGYLRRAGANPLHEPVVQDRVRVLVRLLLMRKTREERQQAQQHLSAPPELLLDTARRLLRIAGFNKEVYDVIQKEADRLAGPRGMSVSRGGSPVPGRAGVGQSQRRPSQMRRDHYLQVEDYGPDGMLTAEGKRKQMAGWATPSPHPLAEWQLQHGGRMYVPYGGAPLAMTWGEWHLAVHACLWLDSFLHRASDRLSVIPALKDWAMPVRWCDYATATFLPAELSSVLEEQHRLVSRGAGSAKVLVKLGGGRYSVDFRSGIVEILSLEAPLPCKWWPPRGATGEPLTKLYVGRSFPHELPSLRPLAQFHSAFLIIASFILLLLHRESFWPRFALLILCLTVLVVFFLAEERCGILTIPFMPGRYAAPPKKWVMGAHRPRFQGAGD
eukprot:Hpha_TRINITY_DN14854_c0_g1::TRINITY_DN14854_c0_g1_i2::g.169242::m.169242